MSQDQKQLLEDLRKSMETKDMTQTAKLLDKKSRKFWQRCFMELLKECGFFMTETGISENIEGTGLVLTMPEILFYGNFENGQPQGSCLACSY